MIYGLLMSRQYGFIGLLMFTRREDGKLHFEGMDDASNPACGESNVWPLPLHHPKPVVETVNAYMQGKSFEIIESSHQHLTLRHTEGNPRLEGLFASTGKLPDILLPPPYCDEDDDEFSDQFAEEDSGAVLISDAQDIFIPNFLALARTMKADYRVLSTFVVTTLRRDIQHSFSAIRTMNDLRSSRRDLERELERVNQQLEVMSQPLF